MRPQDTAMAGGQPAEPSNIEIIANTIMAMTHAEIRDFAQQLCDLDVIGSDGTSVQLLSVVESRNEILDLLHAWAEANQTN